MSSTDDPPEERPTLSVVVPVYNDPEGIRTTLESLVDQTYSVDGYEVLAVDNGSTDETRDVIRAFADAHEHVRLLVEDEIQGSYAARNEGIRHARGSIVAFVDADMSVEETWAESILHSHRERDWDYMGCPIEVYADGRASLATIYDRTLGGFPVEEYIDRRNFSVTACLAVRREVLEAVGSFDDRLESHGDEEFGKRVHDAGFDQYFEPDVVAYHPARETVRAWLEKQFRIGRGAIQLRTYHPEIAGRAHPLHPRKFLPPKPWYFYTRLTDAMDPTVRGTVALYLVDYLSKLARAGGGVYEWIHQHLEASGNTSTEQ